MYRTDKCVVAQVLKVVVIINLIIIDHSRMIQAFRIIEISKYDDGGQLKTRGQLMQGSSTECGNWSVTDSRVLTFQLRAYER